MSHVRIDQDVDRPLDEALAVFAGPVTAWMPVTVGPDEGTWRVQTREGITDVQLVVEVGDPWVLADGTHHRRLVARPDPSAFADLLTAGLTPAVEGELRLTDSPLAGSRLTFEGDTKGRSALTGAIERLLVGDTLGRSGIHTLLEVVAEQIEAAALPDGPHELH